MKLLSNILSDFQLTLNNLALPEAFRQPEIGPWRFRLAITTGEDQDLQTSSWILIMSGQASRKISTSWKLLSSKNLLSLLKDENILVEEDLGGFLWSET